MRPEPRMLGCRAAESPNRWTIDSCRTNRVQRIFDLGRTALRARDTAAAANPSHNRRDVGSSSFGRLIIVCGEQLSQYFYISKLCRCSHYCLLAFLLFGVRSSRSRNEYVVWLAGQLLPIAGLGALSACAFVNENESELYILIIIFFGGQSWIELRDLHKYINFKLKK